MTCVLGSQIRSLIQEGGILLRGLQRATVIPLLLHYNEGGLLLRFLLFQDPLLLLRERCPVRSWGKRHGCEGTGGYGQRGYELFVHGDNLFIAAGDGKKCRKIWWQLLRAVGT